MDRDALLKMVQNKLAVSMVEGLSEEERKKIIAEAISERLSKLGGSWEIERILRDESLKYACEYIQKPEVAERLRTIAIDVVEDVIGGIQKAVGEALEDCIKSKYKRFLSDKGWDDK